MLHKLFLTQNNTQKFLTKSFILIITCFMTIGFLICCASLIIIRIDTPEYVLIPITTSLITFSSFIDSFLLAKLFKENGLFIGIGISVIFILILIFTAMRLETLFFSNLFFTKIVSVFLAGVLGGLLGVNS